MSRDPARVPCTFLSAASQLDDLRRALTGAARVAIDTEVPIDGPGAGLLRVMSVATRRPDGQERSFVVDARDVDPTLLPGVLDGVVADAWNANFDARVIDAAVYGSADVTGGITWWDAQLGDALIHQGRSGFNWYHGLAWATAHYLGIQADGKGTTQLSYTAGDDLSADQIAYAAADAVETLWVGDTIRAELSRAGLDVICAIEMAARPFLDQMERSGLPFDWSGWQGELATIDSQHRQVVGRLAELTGGGQGTLFDGVVEPSWNPASDRQVRTALNTWAAPEVLAWTAAREGAGRQLADGDSITASVLREIGGVLCDALLEFRNYAKILSTYGESIHEHLHADGRLRPQYLQVVGTNTGRLASRNPNAQNFSPRMKPYIRPPDPARVFVHGDLSQAELRYLAQVSGDAALRTAFARGDDVHVTTAATMFGFDPGALRAEDPDRFKRLRQTAKALNFGIAYGSGAASLARSLTAGGTPTTRDEGEQLLTQYRGTYPGTTAWADARVAEIRDIAARTVEIDWDLTMRLARAFGEVASIRREFRQDRRRWPSAEEIADLQMPMQAQSAAARVDEIGWVLGYSAPVALVAGGAPFTFASRTLAGRRQQFNLHLDRLFLRAATEAVTSASPEMAAVRSRFESEHSVTLSRGSGVVADAELAQVFEDRAMRRRYVETLEAEAGRSVCYELLGRAARARVSAMVNAWRNAPIQGGVADIMLCAYADLATRLRRHRGAVPVQTVHDSVIIECDRDDADLVAAEVRAALEEASVRFCPDVVPRADVDVRASLADSDVLEPTPADRSGT